ncbi:hypothetical protein [Kitasatospora sp. NPDC056531]|uniref:hypothetical protein n=1 Tax=Kitasatospora sp. NPDC056531 TaxID=3345856 RepID=UPI0036B65EC2
MTTPPTHATDPPRKLTPGESQVLAHLAAGHDLQHTAAALGVTPTTARNLLHRALRKLGCPTEAAAIALIGTAPPVRPDRLPPTPHTSTRAAPTASGEHGGMTTTPTATRHPAPGVPDRCDQQHRSPVVGTERGPEHRGAPGRTGTDAPTPRQHPPTAPADARKRGGAATGPSASAERQTVPQQDAPSPADRRERIDMALTEAGSRRDLSDEPVASFADLYEEAHTRLVQQVFLLTACRHRAVHCVRRAFGEARRGWAEVVGSGDPEGWVRVRACELALSPWHRGGPWRAHAWTLPHRRIRVRPADEAQAVLPDQDRLTDRDRALLKALRRLSRPQRRALVLHDGLGLPAAAIAVEAESTRAAAEGRVWAARAALAQWVPELVGPDPAAPGFADGLSGLLHRAAVRGCPEPHRSPVPVLRARHRVWTASRTGAAALLTLAVGGATLATLAGLRPAALFESDDPPAPTLCVPAPNAKVAPPGVPLLPGGAPNGIASLWCSPAPGLAAVVVDPQSRAVAGWELPASAEVQAPPPRQGPAACPLWSPLPCTTGPKR